MPHPLHRRLALAGVALLALAAAVATARAAQQRPPRGLVTIQPKDARGNSLGTATGFVATTDGGVVTNLHVVDGAARVEIRTVDGRATEAGEELARLPHADLVLLRSGLDTKAYPPLQPATDPVQPGLPVTVWGNLLEFGPTATDGRILAVAMEPPYGRVLELSAFVRQGSSGSPVLNAGGRIVGVVTFGKGRSMPRNFAVPADALRQLLAKANPEQQTLGEDRRGLWGSLAAALATAGLILLLVLL